MSTFCSYFNQSLCKSCGWIETPYRDQLAKKEEKVRAALSFFPSFELEKSVESPPQGFRNRAKMGVTGSVQKPVIGLLGETELDEGRELLTCPIHHPKLNELIAALPELITQYDLVPYRIRERRGELKGLIAFHSPLSDQMYLRFVLRSENLLASLRALVPELQRRFPSLVCISANIQPIPHAILEGPDEILLTQRGHIDHLIGPLKLKLAPQAFVQTNVSVATLLYQTAAQWTAEARPDKYLELYSGQGAFSFFSAQSATQLMGIEINPSAVLTANETARELGMSHLSFKCSDATRVAEEVARFSPDLILANPPRRGLASGVQVILNSRPAHFLYSSCAIETLANDLKLLSHDYELRRVQLFDMFPHTEHFETLAWLVRRT